MAAAADGTLVAHWLARSGDETYAYDVLLSVSRDAGDTWSEPFSPHDDGTPTEHGFVSLVPTPDGRFRILWLDGREMGLDEAGSPRGSGSMTLRAALLDREGNVAASAVVDARVCDCCSTDAVMTASGSLLAVFRDRTESEIRDISVARLEDERWTPGEPLHHDGWRTAACPVNGPALAVAGDRIACAWFAAAEGKGVVNVAFSDDGGRTFGKPVRVDGGRPLGRVDIVLLDDGSAVASWLEQGAVMLRRVESGGARSEPRVAATADDSRAGGFPRIARLKDEIFLAWTTPGADDRPAHVRTAVLPVAP